MKETTVEDLQTTSDVPGPNSRVQKRSIVDWIIDKILGRPATLHAAS